MIILATIKSLTRYIAMAFITILIAISALLIVVIFDDLDWTNAVNFLDEKFHILELKDTKLSFKSIKTRGLLFNMQHNLNFIVYELKLEQKNSTSYIKIDELQIAIPINFILAKEKKLHIPPIQQIKISNKQNSTKNEDFSADVSINNIYRKISLAIKKIQQLHIENDLYIGNVVFDFENNGQVKIFNFQDTVIHLEQQNQANQRAVSVKSKLKQPNSTAVLDLNCRTENKQEYGCIIALNNLELSETRMPINEMLEKQLNWKMGLIPINFTLEIYPFSNRELAFTAESASKLLLQNLSNKSQFYLEKMKISGNYDQTEHILKVSETTFDLSSIGAIKISGEIPISKEYNGVRRLKIATSPMDYIKITDITTGLENLKNKMAKTKKSVLKYTDIKSGLLKIKESQLEFTSHKKTKHKTIYLATDVNASIPWINNMFFENGNIAIEVNNNGWSIVGTADTNNNTIEDLHIKYTEDNTFKTRGKITAQLKTSNSNAVDGLLNLAAPKWLNKTPETIKLDPTITFDATAIFDAIIPAEDFDSYKNLSYSVAISAQNVKSDIINSNQEKLHINFAKEKNSPMQSYSINLGDIAIGIPKNPEIIKKSNEKLQLKFDSNLKLSSIDGMAHLSNIKLINLDNNESYLAGSMNFDIYKDSILKSKMIANLEQIKMPFCNLSTVKINKSADLQYELTIEGEKFNYQKVREIVKYITGPSSFEFSDIDLDGHVNVKFIEGYNEKLFSNFTFGVKLEKGDIDNLHFSTKLTNIEENEELANATILISDKNDDRDNVYAKIINPAELALAFGLSGYEKLKDGIVTISAEKIAKVITGELKFDGFSYDIGEGKSEGSAHTIKIHNSITDFTYNLQDKIFNIEKFNVKSNVLDASGSGTVNLKTENIELNGKLALNYLNKNKFDIRKFPIFGPAIFFMLQKNHLFNNFEWKVSGPYDKIAENLDIRPTKSMTIAIVSAMSAIAMAIIAIVVSL